MSAPTLPFRRRTENSFSDGVRAQLTAQGITSTDLPVYAGGATNTDTDFFLVVACMESEEIASSSRAYYADIRLSLCCSTALKTTAQHDALASEVSLALDNMPRPALGDEVLFHGWEIVDEQQATEESTHGDVWFVRAGVSDVATP